MKSDGLTEGAASIPFTKSSGTTVSPKAEVTVTLVVTEKEHITLEEHTNLSPLKPAT